MFVEVPDLLEDFAPVAAERGRIGPSRFDVTNPEIRVSRSEGTCEYERDASRPQCVLTRACHENPTRIVGSIAFERRDASGDVIGRVPTMSVDLHHDLALRSTDADVHRSGNNAPFVIEHKHVR